MIPHEPNLNPSLQSAVQAFLGTTETVDRPYGNPSTNGGPRVVVMAGGSSAETVSWLKREGFPYVQRYAVLPSMRTTRWLVPVESARCAREGFKVYSPFNRRARLLKSLASTLLRFGWTGMPRQRLLIAATKRLPLEDLVRDVTGEQDPIFAWSIGAPGRFQKLTVQVMRRDGEILGYIKLPLTEDAIGRVRTAGEVMKRLWQSPSLRPYLPKVFHAGEWCDRYILFQACGPHRQGPVEFGRLHEKLLADLWKVHRVDRPGLVLCEEVAARWKMNRASLKAHLWDLGERALECARHDLAGVMVPCGVSHGDFAPWNMREEDGHLFLFDWESAEWEGPLQWDMFHFHAQTASLLKKSLNGHGFLALRGPEERASLLLYLLDSICRLIEEGGEMRAEIAYREKLLARELMNGQTNAALNPLSNIPVQQTRAIVRPSHITASPASFAGTLLRLLGEHGVRYCRAVGGEEASAELELAVDPADRGRMRGVFKAIRKSGYPVVLRVECAVDSERYHFVCVGEPRVRFVTAKVVYGYRGKRLKWESAESLVKGRERRGEQWVASAEDEFRYLIARDSLKGSLPAKDGQRLRELLVEVEWEEAERIAGEVYGEKRKREAVQACAAGKLGELQKMWRKELSREVLGCHPGNQMTYALRNVWRLIQRWWMSPGLLIAILGPDGVGKSTTTAQLKEDLKPIFPQQREYHWRPQLLLPRPEDPPPTQGNNPWRKMLEQNRHGDPPRGFLISVARLFGVMADYWVGYFTQIRLRLAQCGLVVFDRYYHDILVDSRRYRYGGPQWLLRLLKFALPRWDVFFVILDADEEVIYSRKQELTLREIRRQRGGYRELSTKLPAVVVRTDNGVEPCTGEALRGVAEYLERRFSNSYGN